MSRDLEKVNLDYQAYDSDADVPTDILVANYTATSRILGEPAKFPKANIARVQAHNDALFVELALRGVMIA